eukprot:c4244_g1_i1 orf=2-181(-)
MVASHKCPKINSLVTIVPSIEATMALKIMIPLQEDTRTLEMLLFYTCHCPSHNKVDPNIS